MATLDDFKTLIAYEVPGCPDPLLERWIKEIIDDFCKQTWIWQEDLDPIYIFENLRRYDFNIPTGNRLVGMVRLVTEKDYEIQDYALDGINEQIILSDSVTLDTICTPTAALAPSRDDEAVYKDTLLYDWGEIIAAGVKSRLMFIPDKDFSAPQVAQIHWNAYGRGIGEAKVKSTRLKYKTKAMRISPRRFV